jgi:murein DD-endopeptidase MepM/ murein hydrolase activator NlpD
MRLVLTCLATASLLVLAPASAAAVDTWAWPVTGPVVRGFDPPSSPFGSGHRGIDIAVDIGSEVVAPADGVVAFAGPVGGHLFLTIDHGGGLESTYSWLSSLSVRRGDAVVGGQPIALTGPGHAGAPLSSLHLGVRLDDAYVDPLDYLGALDVSTMIRLAPLAA